VFKIETGASGAKAETIFDLLAALDIELRIVPRSKMSPRDLEDIF
jgi:HTH-type transcriptional regulator/antitoxin HipB